MPPVSTGPGGGGRRRVVSCPTWASTLVVVAVMAHMPAVRSCPERRRETVGLGEARRALPRRPGRATTLTPVLGLPRAARLRGSDDMSRHPARRESPPAGTSPRRAVQAAAAGMAEARLH